MVLNASFPRLESVKKFKHADAHITQFDGDKIQTPEDRLTLVVRTDAAFATRSFSDFFRNSAQGTTGPKAQEAPTAAAQEAYRVWGTEVLSAIVQGLDYDRRYGLSPDAADRTEIHFHSADSLASSMLRKAQAFLTRSYPKEPLALFVSLDDMIHSSLFRRSVLNGGFSEIGFSRLFSLAGEEVGYVGRPGKKDIDVQIAEVREQLKNAGGRKNCRIPIIFLEDNVRRAKTLLWVFDKMQKQGVFEHGEIMCVATCFSVATKEEKKALVCEGRPVPLLVGVDYAESFVDVVTPRDHLFDGLVVRQGETFGRLPSFMLPASEVAKQFKIAADRVGAFIDRILDAGISFCENMEAATRVSPPLGAFIPGQTMAAQLKLSPETPMVDVLRQQKQKKDRRATLSLVR